MSKRKGRKRKLKLDTLLKLKARGEKEAYAYGRILDSPEDAGQEYVARLLSGRHAHATVQQAMLDMVHAQTGKPVMPGYEAKKNMHLATPLDPERILQGQNPTNRMNQRILLQEVISKLDHRAQVIMSLYLNGYTFGEIAQEFEVTQSYIHQLYWKAVQKIQGMIA